MDAEKRISNLEYDINLIRREGAKISDDTRKAIIHDVTEKSKEGRYKALTIGIAIMTMIVLVITYIGIKSIERSTSEYIATSEFKKKIRAELTQDRNESILALGKANELLHKLEVEKKNLSEKVATLSSMIDSKQLSLERVSNVIIKFNMNNHDLSSIIDPGMLQAIKSSNTFAFVKSFGISEISVLKLLASETENFNFHQITKSTVSENVKQIQERYGLTVDGSLGPCTSFVIGALLLDNYELETRSELKTSLYASDMWLTKSFQTCSAMDKQQILRYLDFNDLPLHKQLNSFITVIGMKREGMVNNLIEGIPNPTAYRALEYIGYESPKS